MMYGCLMVVTQEAMTAASNLVERAFPSSSFGDRLRIGRKAQLGENLVYRSGIGIDGALTYGEFDLTFFSTLVDRALEDVAQPATLIDVGSGVGRLCFAATQLWPQVQCAGVECLPELHKIAVDTVERLMLDGDQASTSLASLRFYCKRAELLLHPGGLLDCENAVYFAYSSAFESEGDELSDFSLMCSWLREGTRVITTDKRLVSVDGLWKFELIEQIDGANVGTGGQSTGYIYEVVQSRRSM